jgi:mycofactocin precursor peptide peptidase
MTGSVDRSAVHLGRLTSAEVHGRADVLLVPLGATEQHGDHLTLSTDTVIATAWAEAVADHLDRAVVAPPLPYGSSGEHQAFPGTLSIGGPALRLVVIELVRSAAATFDRVVFLSGHAGNERDLRQITTQARAEGHDVQHLIPTWPDWPGPVDAHAGRTETSLLLHLRPDLVRPERAAPGETRPLAQLLDRLMADGVAAVSPSGVLGDPTGADAEQGRRLFDDLVTRTVAALTRPDPSGPPG